MLVLLLAFTGAIGQCPSVEVLLVWCVLHVLPTGASSSAFPTSFLISSSESIIIIASLVLIASIGVDCDKERW